MTLATAPRPPAGQRVHWLADLFLAVFLVALDAAVAFGAVFTAGLAQWADADEDPSPDSGPVIALGVVTLIAGLIAVALFRGRLPIAGVFQSLAALALAGVTLVGASSVYRETHPTPRPTSDYHGPGAQCRSGGDNSECAHSGG